MRLEVLAADITVAVRRLLRHPCQACFERRVLFVLVVNEQESSPRLCARCAGLR